MTVNDEIYYIARMEFDRKFVTKSPAAVYVTTPVIDMVPVFGKDDLAIEAVKYLGNAAHRHDLEIAAYAVMPSYMHAILVARDDLDIGEFLYTYKWLTSRAIMCMDLGEFAPRLLRRGKFKLWMRRHDHLIISTRQQLDDKTDYIHNAPVKAGLCKKASEWKFSSAADWSSGKAGPIDIVKNLDWLKLV